MGSDMAEELYLWSSICYVLIKIRVATFDTNHSVTDSTQTISHGFNPEASQFRRQVSTARKQTVDVSGEIKGLSIS
jgi:hypothetical protein